MHVSSQPSICFMWVRQGNLDYIYQKGPKNSHMHALELVSPASIFLDPGGSVWFDLN